MIALCSPGGGGFGDAAGRDLGGNSFDLAHSGNHSALAPIHATPPSPAARSLAYGSTHTNGFEAAPKISPSTESKSCITIIGSDIRVPPIRGISDAEVS